MQNKDKIFKGQLADENYILFFRKHWLYMLPTILIFFAVCIIAAGAIFSAIVFGLKNTNIVLYRFMLVAFLVGFLAYTHWFFVKLLEHFLTVCILSDKRLLLLTRSVYLKNSKETADLTMIQDVRKEQNGLMHNLFKYGDMIITFSSSSAIMVLRDVPNVDFHFRALMRAKESSVNTLHHQDEVAAKADLVG